MDVVHNGLDCIASLTSLPLRLATTLAQGSWLQDEFGEFLRGIPNRHPKDDHQEILHRQPPWHQRSNRILRPRPHQSPLWRESLWSYSSLLTLGGRQNYWTLCSWYEREFNQPYPGLVFRSNISVHVELFFRKHRIPPVKSSRVLGSV